MALLVRTAFLESEARLVRLFEPFPPEWICQFVERVPMHKGRLDAKGSTATAYCWVIWVQPATSARVGADVDRFRHRMHHPAFVWLPPCRARLTRPGDYD